MQESQHDKLIARIEDLETRVTFQEQTIDSLNNALFQCQQEQQRLLTQFEWLAQKSRELAERMPDSGGRDEPPPPHY